MSRAPRPPALLRADMYLDADPAFAGFYDAFDDAAPACGVRGADGAIRPAKYVGGDPVNPYASGGDAFVDDFVAACAAIAAERGHLDADDADDVDADDVDPHRPRVTDDGLTLDNDDTFGSDE